MSTKGMICIVLSLSLFVLLFTVGCGKSTEETIENVIGGLIEAENQAIEADNNSSDVNEDDEINDGNGPGSSGDNGGSISVEHQAEWPSDLPSYVPRMEGDLTEVVITHPEEGTKSYIIAYENLQIFDADVYEKELLSNGWTIDGTVEMGEAWMIYASIENKASITMSAEIEENSGMMIVVIF